MWIIKPHIIADNIDNLLRSLKEAATALFHWFDDNIFKCNPGKCHLLITSNEKVTVHIGEYKLDFDYHISDVCKKASGKLNALDRIVSFIELTKRDVYS